MAKKIIISDKRKQTIKDNYEKYRDNQHLLKGDDLKYFNKVKGGKVRAENSLKDKGGKYVSKTLQEQIIRTYAAKKKVSSFKETGKRRRLKAIDDIVKEAKLTKSELKEYYEQHREVFERMGGVTDVSRNSNQIEQQIKDVSGKIYVNGEQVSKAQALYKLAEFNQFLKSNLTVVDFSLKPFKPFAGGLKIELPDVNEMQAALLDKLGIDSIEDLDDVDGADLQEAIESISEDYNMDIYVSPPKGKKK